MRRIKDQLLNASNDAIFASVAQLMEQGFNETAGLVGALGVEFARQLPEVLAGVVEVQKGGGLAETVFGDAPEPDGTIYEYLREPFSDLRG